MFEWVAVVADIVFIVGALYGAFYVIRRWKLFKWWLAVGYWFNAQAWGARLDTLPTVSPSCWDRVLPAPLCRLFASFFLLTVTPPSDGQSYEAAKARIDHDMDEIWKVAESWRRITARHERRGQHPHYCHNPTNRQWCSDSNCSKEVTGRARVIADRAYYYCPEHFPDQYQITDDDG